jgi:hypothetical protein
VLMKSVNQLSSTSQESGSATATASEGIKSSRVSAEEGPECYLFSGFQLISKTRAVFRKEVAILSYCFHCMTVHVSFLFALRARMVKKQ